MKIEDAKFKVYVDSNNMYGAIANYTDFCDYYAAKDRVASSVWLPITHSVRHVTFPTWLFTSGNDSIKHKRC